MPIRQIRRRPDNGDQYLVEVEKGDVTKATGPLNMSERPEPREIKQALQADFEPDAQALHDVRSSAGGTKRDYELDAQDRVVDTKKSAPTPMDVD